jgi:hypothetical protein
MKIKLVDVDSKMPNLALMKISAYYKAKGDTVSFDIPDPDLVYASVIFKKNKHLVDGLRFWHPDAKIIIGGSGYDLASRLPDEIELMKPDYSLYHDIDYSLGFSSRGCIRNCHFCVVPQKEGKFKRAQHPDSWHDPKFNKIMFLDNNILVDREYFFEVTQWCIDHKLEVCFNQGLDARLLDVEIAKQLLKMKTWKSVFFAWDHVRDEQAIKEKIKVLKQAGFTKSKLRDLVQFYVYVNDDSEYETGVYRCRELKKLWCNAFVMFNIDLKPTPRIQKLRRWANKKQLFWSIDISEYNRSTT